MTLSLQKIQKALHLDGYVIIGAWLSEDETSLYIQLRPYRYAKSCCPFCHQPSPGYDKGTKNKKWRHVDLEGYRCFLVMDLPRVQCPEHGVHTMDVSFARHDSRFTREFELMAVDLVRRTSKNKASQLLGISFVSVSAILERVAQEQKETGKRPEVIEVLSSKKVKED